MDLTLLESRLQTEHPVKLESWIDPHPQLAAVLVLLYQRNGQTHLLLIQRSGNLKSHPGEIAFPGGVFEEDDENLMMTALRETEEEVGLQLQPEIVMARLPEVLTLTEFRVVPFVAFADKLPPMKKNPREVKEILEVPLTRLLATQQRDVGYPREKDMWLYLFGQHRVWGATARIIHKLSVLI